ncbi:MAG: hypothetical protein KGQ59_03550 [Bdellovibrionales bacterium]|nr:hypothetical protein [Bdellovibrionales bacterium]
MKAPLPRSLKTTLKVLVFQDGLSSRNFEIPISWISKLGWYLGGSLAVTVLSLSLAVHYWRQSHRAQPERLRELENQIRLLVEAQQKTQTKPAPAPALTPASLPVASTSAPAPAPVPTRALEQALVPSPLSDSTLDEVPLVARPSVPVQISSSAIRWQGRKLKLQFDIRFTGEEGKSQQGRIIVIARGPEALLTYPSGALQGLPSKKLFDPEKGEFFSVSRYRQTKVEFAALDSQIDTLEILIFGNDLIEGKRKLLIREILKVPATRGGTREPEREDI